MLILSTNHPLHPLSSSPSMESSPSPPSASWSIYGRLEITQRYEILGRIGSGAYSDVYRGRRSSDGLAVALKEVHDYQSAAREIEALQTLGGSPNVVDLVEYFWREGDDAVLVLEFLPVDLASVVADANRSEGRRIPTGEIKRWMLQILQGVDACHRNRVVHRDLKPSNLLVSAEGVLKLADFGQARILEESRSIPQDEHIPKNEASFLQQPSIPQQVNQRVDETEFQDLQGPGPSCADDYLQELDVIKGKYAMVEDPSLQDGNASCLATCSSTGEIEDEEAAEYSEHESGGLTSCVGTRWFRAPELLYGSTNYGQGVDLWSLGCIFAELLSLETLFPGSSDIDQFSKIINVLGDLNEETFPGCSKLPDYSKVFFSKVETPIGLQGRLPDRTPDEVDLVRKLVCYDPASRATAMELLQDEYFCQEPLPVPLNELKVPSGNNERGLGEWGDYNDWRSESDFEEFQRMDPMINHKAFF